MRNFILGIALTVVVFLVVKQCSERKMDSTTLSESTALIQQQLKNVGKLVVTEGHFSEVFNYENSKEFLGNYLTADKKALVVVNADVTIGYDLSQLQTRVDDSTKTLYIEHIPEPEIKIHPELEYYDLQADFFNPFEADDYNQIQQTVKASLLKKLQASDLRKNAQNRLLSELSKLYILTNSLGWTLQYNQMPVRSSEDLEGLKL